MPELAVVDVEARVAALVEAHRPELLALVDRELEPGGAPEFLDY